MGGEIEIWRQVEQCGKVVMLFFWPKDPGSLKFSQTSIQRCCLHHLSNKDHKVLQKGRNPASSLDMCLTYWVWGLSPNSTKIGHSWCALTENISVNNQKVLEKGENEYLLYITCHTFLHPLSSVTFATLPVASPFPPSVVWFCFLVATSKLSLTLSLPFPCL